MISFTAINQLLEREIDEHLLDWSTTLVACMHSKDCMCVCLCVWVHVFDVFECMCVGVSASLC